MRSHSAGAMLLLLDDFFFADADAPVGIELEKYNIYCDDQKVGSVPLTRQPSATRETDGAIRVSSLANDAYSVVPPAGACVAQSIATGEIVVPVTPGVYIVRANTSTAKVIVK